MIIRKMVNWFIRRKVRKLWARMNSDRFSRNIKQLESLLFPDPETPMMKLTNWIFRKDRADK